MDVSEARRLKSLEDENARLGFWPMPCGAEGPRGKEVVTPAAKRKAVPRLRMASGERTAGL